MEQICELQIPKRVVFGCNSSKGTGLEVKRLGKKKVLIVTDKTMAEIGNLMVIQKSLEGNDIEYETFDKVLQEPVMEYVELGLDMYKGAGCDAIIALGGGSPIDTAKAIGAMATNPGKITDYMGIDKVKKPGVPLIAIPTTAGTGSEMSKYSILTDAKKNVKYLTGSPYLIPTVALVDPLLTLSMPKGVTAATGMDALCHAIEGYVSVKGNPVADIYCLSAITLISQNLRQAWADGRNVEARTKTMLGAMYAGIALGVSTVTLVHGMSRPIGAYFHVPHGLSNAALLSPVMEFSTMGNPRRFARVAEAMGEHVEGMSYTEASEKAVNAVKRLVKDLRIPTLRDLGVEKEKLTELSEQMAKDAINSGSPGNNPRQATIEEIVELYDMAY